VIPVDRTCATLVIRTPLTGSVVRARGPVRVAFFFCPRVLTRNAIPDNSCRNSYSGSPARNVFEHYRVRSDSCVVSNFYSSENLCTCSDVHVPPDDRGAWFRASDTYCDLLRYQTVGTDH